MLRELAGDGRVESRGGKKLHHPGALPSVTLADITAPRQRRRTDRNADRMGRGRARPAAENPHPGTPRKARPREAAGVGDRALLRVEETDDEDVRYSGRVIKVIDHAKAARARHLSARCRAAAGGWCRSTRSSSARSSRSRQAQRKDAQDGDLIAVSVQRQGRFGLPVGARRGAARLAQERARGQPDRDPRPRNPACLSAVAIEAEARRGKARRRSPAARTGASCRSSPSIRPTPRTTTTRCTPSPIPTRSNPGGHIITVAIADVAHYVRPGSALDREALKRGNSVYFPDRVVPMLPERISNDLCSLRPNEDRAALAVRMIIGADGRKRSHTFHRVLMRSAAKLHYAQAQAAIDGRTDDDHGSPARSGAQAALRRLRGAQARPRRRAIRSISICPSAKSCSRPTARSTASSRRSGSKRTG